MFADIVSSKYCQRYSIVKIVKPANRFVTGITNSISGQSYDEDAMKVMGPVLALHKSKSETVALPEDAANLLAFLSSDTAKEINGAIIPIDRASLPCRPGDPPFSAWVLYGPDDELGALNLLTPQNAQWKQQIRSRRECASQWTPPPVNKLIIPTHGRHALKQTIYQRGAGRPVHDDELSFNTQIGPQWDGFRHLTYLDGRKFYNGTVLDGVNDDGKITAAGTVTQKLGTHVWVQNGVLLDFYSWAVSQGKEYELIGDKANYAITVEELKAVAKAQEVEI
ncbi:hypothetical protein BDV12DRAFT_204465 [Aspergillus spectabilis]